MGSNKCKPAQLILPPLYHFYKKEEGTIIMIYERLPMALLAVCAFFSTPVYAWSIAEWLGLDKIAADAGAKAAHEVQEASRNIPLTTNQFGLIIDEYYSDDAIKRAKARRIVNNVFPDLAAEKDPKLQFAVSLDFANIDTSAKALTADIWFIDAPNIGIAKALVYTGVRYKGETVSSAPTTTPATLESASEKINRYLQLFGHTYTLKRGEVDPYVQACGRTNIMCQSSNQGCIKSNNAVKVCNEKLELGYLQRAIFSLTESGIDLPPVARVTRAWKGGGFAVILIPESEFDAQANIDLRLRFHVAGDVTKTAKDFETPMRISVPLMRQTSSLESSDPLYPKFRYAIVDLRVADFLGSR